MGLKLTVDTIEEVEEPFRALYAEKDGKFHLGVDDLPDTDSELKAVRNALKKSNAEAAKERERRRSYDALGKTPEEIQTMLDELNGLQELKEKHEMTEAEKKGQWDELKKQMNEKQEAQLRAKDTLILAEQQKASALRQSIQQHIIQSSAIAAIAEHKGIAKLLLPFVSEHIRVTEEDGKFSVHVVDDKGEPKVNDKGEPITISEFVGEMQTDPIFSRAFEGSGSSGGGTRQPNGGMISHPGISKKTDLKNEKQRAEFVDKYGIERYRSLPD